MKANYLFPNYFKRIDWVLFIPLAAVFFLYLFSGERFLSFITDSNSAVNLSVVSDLNPTAVAVLIVMFTISLLFISFSREKDEDEYVAKLRGDSLVWATIANFMILMAATMLLYDFTFLYFMCISMYTVLLLFIIKFNLALKKMRKSAGHKE